MGELLVHFGPRIFAALCRAGERRKFTEMPACRAVMRGVNLPASTSDTLENLLSLPALTATQTFIRDFIVHTGVSLRPQSLCTSAKQ